MGLLDYILEKALNLPHAPLHRHECRSALTGDTYPFLPPGTPVFCHFTLNIAEHSGICVGDRIVHLDGDGRIISSTPHEFLARLDGSNLATSIYYAATGRNRPLADEDVAARALAALGQRRDYSLLADNCHGFTIRCLRGDTACRAAWSLREVENAITAAFGTDAWRWRRWKGWK